MHRTKILVEKMLSQSVISLSISPCNFELNTRTRISAPSLVSLELTEILGWTHALESLPSWMIAVRTIAYTVTLGIVVIMFHVETTAQESMVSMMMIVCFSVVCRICWFGPVVYILRHFPVVDKLTVQPKEKPKVKIEKDHGLTYLN
uniref:Uncharacterized protein n=1 Tax=Oryza rufipogon TaxID=4529 RepID=A0A0E0R6M4_ORYRU